MVLLSALLNLNQVIELPPILSMRRLRATGSFRDSRRSNS